MNLREVYRRARSMPPKVFLKKVAHFGATRVKGYAKETQDILLPSRVAPDTFAGQEPTRLLMKPVPAELITRSFPLLGRYLERLLAHEFDLLGSGWTRVAFGAAYPGLEGHRYDTGGGSARTDGDGDWLEGRINKPNLTLARQTWREIRAPYEPIDWHVDFKSGYRWDPGIWWLRVPYGHQPGVDIKVPWELARMQHLTALALGFTTAPSEKTRARYADECRNQILDFIAQNPARFGVNWRCPMDVAIRAANWVLAIDLFRAQGYEFDHVFYSILLASLVDHGRFVRANLERASDFRGNHYLADIAGLAFIAASLPPSNESNEWLEFAFRSLIEECDFQFFDDGSNFEGSTSYHRLSVEMLVHPLLMLLGLPEERVRGMAHPPRASAVPEKAWMRIRHMRDFTMAVSKPGFRLLQVGDCDSGRFFKLQPAFWLLPADKTKLIFIGLPVPRDLTEVLIEDQLDHRHLIGLIDGIFNELTLTYDDAKAGAVDTHLVRTFREQAKGLTATLRRISGAAPLALVPETTTAESSIVPTVSTASRLRREPKLTRSDEAVAAFTRDFTAAPVASKHTYRFARSLAASHAPHLYAFEDFGLYVYRADDFFLSVRCGSVGQMGRGGHDHNDQLSIELEIDGVSIVTDPGTFVYTPLPEQRNLYRSVFSHFTPRIAEEEGVLFSGGLFYIGNAPSGCALHVTESSFLGRVHRGGCGFRRLVRIASDHIEVLDLVDGGHELQDLSVDLAQDPAKKTPYSPGYGMRRREFQESGGY